VKAFDLSIPSAKYVGTVAEAEQWVKYFLESYKDNDGALGIDSETSGIRRHKDVVIIWSLSDGKERICAPAELLQAFKPVIENPDIALDGTNINFDAHMFANTGIDLSKAKEFRNTICQSWLLNENNMGNHGLKETTFALFGRKSPEFTDIFGQPPKGKDRKSTGELIRAALATPEGFANAVGYASLDAYNSTMVRKEFDKRLAQVELYPGYTLLNYFYDVEVPFTKVLYKMERRGVTVDKGHLTDMQPQMQADMLNIEKEIAKAAGKVVNLKSPQQVRGFFFDVLQKKPTKYTDGGASGIKNPSTDASVLEDWAGEGDKYAQALLKHRGISKIHDTYVKGLQEWIDQSYRIHTTLNQTGTVTGRLSSSEPNLQNIPRASEDKFLIREAFIAGEGKILVVADYEQLEMRLMAHFSDDQKMIDAIHKGIDLHCLTVNEIYGYPYEDCMAAKKAEKSAKKAGYEGLADWPNEALNKPSSQPGMTLRQYYMRLMLLRQAAKATGFGIIYGIGGAHLAANLTKDLGELYTLRRASISSGNGTAFFLV
jgi:DNA polymerase-1